MKHIKWIQPKTKSSTLSDSVADTLKVNHISSVQLAESETFIPGSFDAFARAICVV